MVAIDPEYRLLKRGSSETMWSYDEDKGGVIVSTFIVVVTMIVALIIRLPFDIVRQLGTHYI